MKSIKPTGKRTLVSIDEAIKRVEGYVKPVVEKPEKEEEVKCTDEDIYLTFVPFNDIRCVGADGKVFEEYKKIRVAPIYFHFGDKNTPTTLTPAGANKMCKDKKMFLPSFALSCNILERLLKHKATPGFGLVLNQYRKRLIQNQSTYHQNTVVNYQKGEIIHYPGPIMFGTLDSRNLYQPFEKIKFDFDPTNFRNFSLDESPPMTSEELKFLKNLTGLEDPLKTLKELEDYFEIDVRCWFQDSHVDRWNATLLGHTTDSGSMSAFGLHTGWGLENDYGLTRGVKRADD